MGHNDHINFALDDAINDLVENGNIEKDTPAFGVAQQVITSGLDSLTPKQRHVYETYITPELKKRYAELEAIRIRNSNID